MSYLTVSVPQRQKKKELNVISLQQVVGQHILLSFKGNIEESMIQNQQERPDKYKIIKEKVFLVLGPNRNDITLSGNGKSPWILLVGYKGIRKQLYLLLIGNRIWGIEMDQGMKMKKEASRLGSERLISFLRNQVESMINTPDNWESIEVYLRA